MRRAEDKDRIEAIKEKIIREKGWYIPALHEKYLKELPR